MQVNITHISKEDFLLTFYIAFYTALTKSNIRGGFRRLGLVLYDPDYVISQLDIVILTSRPLTAASLLPP